MVPKILATLLKETLVYFVQRWNKLFGNDLG